VGSPIINLPAVLPIWRYLRRNTPIKNLVFGSPSKNSTGSKYEPLSQAEKRDVETIFAEENQKLYELLGREIPAWRH
jgi:hypothetical protein